MAGGIDGTREVCAGRWKGGCGWGAVSDSVVERGGGFGWVGVRKVSLS